MVQELKSKKENIISLPDIEVKKNVSVRLVNKAVSITFIVIVATVIIAVIVAFNVNMRITISGEGVLRPSGINHIHSTEAGIIKKVLINSGDTVKINQPLVVLDSIQLKKNLIDIQSQIASAENTLRRKLFQESFDKIQDSISLSQAEIQLLKSKASFRDRISSFFPKTNMDSLIQIYTPGKNIVLDYSMADIKSAEEDIKLKKLDIQKQKLVKYDLADISIKLDNLYAQKKILKDHLKNIVIKSPVSGIILSESVKNLTGNYVSEGSSLFDIAETNNWEVILFISERDINQVKTNNKVKIHLDALSSNDNYDLFNATVTSIAEEPNTGKDEYSEFTGLYRITALFETNGEHCLDVNKLKYGYKLKGEIITNSGKIIDLLIKYFKKLI